MPPIKHGKLSPSAAKRWMNCPGSVALEQALPNPPQSEYATEGSLAHRMAEIKIQHEVMKKPFNKRECEDVKDAINRFYASAKEVKGSFDEIKENTSKYVEWVKSVVPQKGLIETERPMRLQDWVPEGMGTCDLSMIDFENESAHLVDFKYGQVRVPAVRNEQLMIYALGLLSDYLVFGDELKTVKLSIFQPRIDYVETDTWKTEDLLEWGNDILKPTASIAYREPTGNLRYFKAGKWCKYCKAAKAGVCPLEKTYAERVAKIAKEQDVPVEENLDDLSIKKEEIEKILPYKHSIERYLNALEEASIDYLAEGEIIPGLKLVKRTSPERWAPNVNESGVSLLDDKGKRMTVKQARKKLSDEDFEKVRPYIVKSPDKLRVAYKD